ncbi:MAG: hypothetical protein KAJ19_22900 [Gammaproteobacteria bacterium]|nr:hypothetical protein [Gammaproteobacteria bacterium]
MPIGLKMEMTGFSNKRISFKNMNVEDSEWFELPVTRLEFEMVPDELPMVTVQFLVSDMEMVLEAAELAKMSGLGWKLFCIHCKEELVKTNWQMEEGNWRVVWLCACEHPTVVDVGT